MDLGTYNFTITSLNGSFLISWQDLSVFWLYRMPSSTLFIAFCIILSSTGLRT